MDNPTPNETPPVFRSHVSNTTLYSIGGLVAVIVVLGVGYALYQTNQNTNTGTVVNSSSSKVATASSTPGTTPSATSSAAATASSTAATTATSSPVVGSGTLSTKLSQIDADLSRIDASTSNANNAPGDSADNSL